MAQLAYWLNKKGRGTNVIEIEVIIEVAAFGNLLFGGKILNSAEIIHKR
jgi:hypothetical protein